MPPGSVDVCQAQAQASASTVRGATSSPSCDADICRYTFANGAVEIVSVKLNSSKYQIFSSPQEAADKAASQQAQGRDYFTTRTDLVALVNANFFRSVGDNRVRGLAIGEPGKVITNQHDADLGGTWSVIYCQASRTCSVVRDIKNDPADLAVPKGVDFAATGYGDTLIAGAVNARADDRFPNEARPRTQLGISSTRWYIGVMKAGKNSQLAEYMLKAGAKDAMILDGGGSTFMYLRPPLAMDAGVETVVHTTRPVPHYIGIRKAN
jgi:exopolysaccharide biosynthesis protein